jgi:hypothetical protein
LNTVKVEYYCAGVYHLSRGHHSASVHAVGRLQDPVHISTAKISHAAGMDAMDGENDTFGAEISGTWAILTSFLKFLGVGEGCRFAIEWRW